MLFNWTPSLIPGSQSGMDEVFLGQIRRGFAGPDLHWGWSQALWSIAVLGGLALAVFLLRKRLKPKSRLVILRDPDIIEARRTITDLIEESIRRRTVYELEVFDKAYPDLCRCRPVGVGSAGDIELQPEPGLDPALGFVDKPVRAMFRLNRQDQQEVYAFESRTRHMDFATVQGVRERVVRVVCPDSITRGEKRRYVRVEPTGDYAVDMTIFLPVQRGAIVPLKELKSRCTARVADISLGGAKVLWPTAGADPGLAANDAIHVYFSLPVGVFDAQEHPPRLFVLARVIEVRPAAQGRYEIRMMFTHRGRLEPGSQLLTFRPTTRMTFQDLSRWIQAYQRHVIRREKGLADSSRTEVQRTAPPTNSARPLESAPLPAKTGGEG